MRIEVVQADVTHTYLFQEGIWTASGHLLDREGLRFDVVGRTEVRHQPDHWLSDSRLRVVSEPPVEIENEYRLAPFTADCLSAQFTMQHSTLGVFAGTMAIVGASILSSCRSHDGRHWSLESLVQLDESRYRNVGAFFSNGVRASSWDVELLREPALL